MSEPFLEEQLKRIRQMTARIAEARNQQQELSEQIAREREQRHAWPLENVDDFHPKPAERVERRHESADDRSARARHARPRRRR